MSIPLLPFLIDGKLAGYIEQYVTGEFFVIGFEDFTSSIYDEKLRLVQQNEVYEEDEDFSSEASKKECEAFLDEALELYMRENHDKEK